MGALRWGLFIIIVFVCVFAVSCPARGQDEHKPLYVTKYNVINVHRHCTPVSLRAVQAELEVMRRVGVNQVVMLDGQWLGNNIVSGRLREWLDLKRQFPEQLILFANINFRRAAKDETFFEDAVSELTAQHRMGVQGIKVFKQFGMKHRDADGKLIPVDDPRLDPFWERCGELGLPVLIHSADPKEYWYPRTYNSLHYGIPSAPLPGKPRRWEDAYFGQGHHYKNSEMPKWEELIEQRNNLLGKHPNTTFIGAHMGSLTFDLDQLAKTLDEYPNFNVDCAARLRILGRLNPQAVRDFFVKYQDRILFGTDSNVLIHASAENEEEVKRWQDRAARFYSRHFEYFESDHTDIIEPYGFESAWLRLAGVKLPPDVLEKFYHGNAERLILKQEESK